MISIALLLLASVWHPIAVDHCDIVVDVDHWAAWGGNEVHRINGWFMDYSVGNGVWETNVRTISTHPMIDKETKEGIRVASRCRIIGQWMDEKRTVILPRKVEVLRRRQD